MASLPAHTIMENGRYFLRLQVEQRIEEKITEYRLVLKGDAATKPLSEWSASLPEAKAAFDAERARYE